jgi:acyl carrier protein
MSREKIVLKLTEIFREVFRDDDIVISDQMTAEDVKRWDSIANINMIVMVEEEFNVNLTTKEIAGIVNVGDLIAVIERKLGDGVL